MTSPIGLVPRRTNFKGKYFYLLKLLGGSWTLWKQKCNTPEMYQVRTNWRRETFSYHLMAFYCFLFCIEISAPIIKGRLKVASGATYSIRIN